MNHQIRETTITTLKFKIIIDRSNKNNALLFDPKYHEIQQSFGLYTLIKNKTETLLYRKKPLT